MTATGMMTRNGNQMAPRGLAVKVSLAVLIGAFCFSANAVAQVNWLEPLGYQKPQFVPVNRPNEATVANKYWIDLSLGSGTSCTQSAPCRSFDDVLGKPGMQGGPAILYVKGTGGMSWFSDTVYGSGDADCRVSSCANWILIRTWPAGSPGCASECTATISGNSNINSANAHHIMFDGGPDKKIRFNSNGGVGTYALVIQAHYVTVYRVQQFCGTNKQLGFAVGGFAVSRNVSFINNEFYGCANTGDQSSAVYVGPGDGGGYENFIFQNNIVRDFFGEGVEINPRVTSYGLQIIGNAIHNAGKGTCATTWNCRPAITVSVQSGGGNQNTFIANNLMWDLGSSCVWDRGGGSPAALIVGNTCYDYGKGSGGPVPMGISSYGNSGRATIRDNIIYSPAGVAPFDGSSYTASNNLCGSSHSCGSAKQSWSGTTVLSTDPNSSNFLRIGAGSAAVRNGIAVSALTIDYAGGVRPPYDIGAFSVVGVTTNPPAPPTDVRIIR